MELPLLNSVQKLWQVVDPDIPNGYFAVLKTVLFFNNNKKKLTQYFFQYFAQYVTKYVYVCVSIYEMCQFCKNTKRLLQCKGSSLRF